MKTTIAALAVLLPATALADTWTEQAPGTYTRTVRLDGGRDYALAADIADGSATASPFRLDVSLAGTPVASLPVHYGDSVEGVTFRAPKAAPYTLTLTIPADQAPCDGCGVWYAIGADCRADTGTRCLLPVGKEEPNRAWNYVRDDDWFRATLRGRQRYEAWLHDPQDCVLAFRALDAQGREVPSSTIGHPGDGISIRFTPPADGAYFVAVSGACLGPVDTGGPYGVALYAR
jgi:hypothetical protein